MQKQSLAFDATKDENNMEQSSSPNMEMVEIAHDRKPAETAVIESAEDHEATDGYDTKNDTDSTEGLISHRHTSTKRFRSPIPRQQWIQPYWLGLCLTLTLFAFWLLDSLKDSVLATLVSGNLEQHQPTAKLISVVTTLALVWGLEAFSRKKSQPKDSRQQKNDEMELDGLGKWNKNIPAEEKQRSHEDVLDGGGTWTRMSVSITHQREQTSTSDDRVSQSLFTYIGGTYAFLFMVFALVLKSVVSFENTAKWHIFGYLVYASIESFGSLSVATFWSYANSTLSLKDAERYYGLMIAMAQIGAFGGSTVATAPFYSASILFLIAGLITVLQVLLIYSYDKKFNVPNKDKSAKETRRRGSDDKNASGLQLIFRHGYVLMILGVSCLYEVAITCLDYQMKLLGFEKFDDAASDEAGQEITFMQFMGHWGQLTNMISWFLAYLVFPYLIQHFGLRWTVRIFPTLLLLVTAVSYGFLPGNLTVLFLSLSLLKAMSYSIHDPATEILYIPTSDAIKFRARFWIDVVGTRIAKAIGSSINAYAGSVTRIIKLGAIPSFGTSLALWIVCYSIGIQFDKLIQLNITVGMDNSHSDDISIIFTDTGEDDSAGDDEAIGLAIDDSLHGNQDLLGGVPSVQKGAIRQNF